MTTNRDGAKRNPTGTKTSGGFTTTYTLTSDGSGRVTSVTDPLGHSTTYTYTISSGEVDTVTVDPTGVNPTTTTTLNAAGQTVSVKAARTDVNQTTTYAYDPRGLLKTVTDPNSGVTTYGYDNADQLTSVTPPGSGATAYTYKAAGNRTNKGAAASFVWNALNQLTSATQNSITTTNVFNGDGLRMSRTDSDDGSTTTWTWDSAGTGQQLDDGGTQFLYGALGLYAHVKSSQTYYDLTDGLGSVLAEVKSDGTNAVSYQYDVYGNILNQRGSLYDERQFTGEQADSTGRYAS